MKVRQRRFNKSPSPRHCRFVAVREVLQLLTVK